ncbi:TPR repeat protein [Bradyrhizobium sp. S3.2.6]|uniref:CHAT domain-containing protein n=1 Tax=Bradyrhizobium sp. S3.2.6 TaxID=3156428 RepID=UPI0033921020
MVTLPRLAFGLGLGLAASFCNATTGVAEVCAALPTRPADSIHLLPNTIGKKTWESRLSACQAVDNPDARFAEATFLVNMGDISGATEKLTPLIKVLPSTAALLLADIITEQWKDAQASLQKSEELYRPLLDGQHPEADEGLGVALLKGSSDPVVRKRAFELLQGAIEKGSTSAQARMGASLFYTGINSEEKAAGLQKMETAAATGNRAAVIELGRIFSFGLGVERNQERAEELLSRPVVSEAAESQYLLALLWKAGWRIPASVSKPMSEELQDLVRRLLARPQAGPGAGPSLTDEQRNQMQKRVMELNSLMQVHWDGDKAISLLRLSASQEYLPAIVSLGTALSFGKYGQFDPTEGIHWLMIAYERGDAAAAERLGILHEMKVAGLNDDDAVSYYKTAADRTFARSMFAMERLKPTNTLNASVTWAEEQKRTSRIIQGLGLHEFDRAMPYQHLYARNLPEASPYFEAARYVRLSVLTKDGEQVFGGLLSAGDRVRLARGSGEIIRVTRMGALGGDPLLGTLYRDQVEVGTMSFGSDQFAEVTGTIPDFGNDISAAVPGIPETGIVFRADEGFENAISVHDPDFKRELRTSGYKWSGPYDDGPSHLYTPTDVSIPNLPRLAATIRGGTLLEIIVDGSPIFKGRIPDRTNLYLDFAPADIRAGIHVAWPQDVTKMPSEAARDWMPKPAPTIVSGDRSIGWIYSQYDTAADKLYASFVEANASVAAWNAELKGDYQSSLRLRCSEYELAHLRAGGAAVETARAYASIATSLEMNGRLDEAIVVRETALSAMKDLDERPYADVVEQLLSLANLYSAKRDLTRAIAAAREALAMATLLPRGASAISSQPYDSRFSTYPQQAKVLAPMADLPHEMVQRATEMLARFYGEVEDFDRSYIYLQQLAAFDLFDDPEEETNGNMEAYVALADVAHRSGNHRVGWIAGSFVLPKAKADAGQRDKPDPIPPVTIPAGIEGVFGPAEKSAIVGRALLLLGDAYWAAGKPWSYSSPAYEASLKSGLGSTGPGTSLAVRAGAKLAFANWITGRDDSNLSMLKDAGAFDSVRNSFPFVEALDRDTRAMFASAYLGTLQRPPAIRDTDALKRASEASSVFLMDDNESFSRNYQVARLRRRANSSAQLSAIDGWVNARSDFDRSIRVLNSSIGSKFTDGNLEKQWDASRRARDRLSAAEDLLQRSFSVGLVSLTGADLIDQVQKALAPDEVVVSLTPTRFAVYALVITNNSIAVRFAAINDAELVERVRAMRNALDPLQAGAPASKAGGISTSMEALLRMRPYTIGLFEAEAVSKRRWILISHDVLRNIPIEAIPLNPAAPDDLNTVGKDWDGWPGLSKEIGYLPSLGALVDLRSDFPSSTATNPISVIADPLLPGDPRYDSSFASTLSNIGDWFRRKRTFLNFDSWLGSDVALSPIPETAHLAYDVVKQLGGSAANVYVGSRATRKAIESAGDLQKSRVLVFATHGETAESFPQIGEPFLVLTSDQKDPMGFEPLRASEISRLNLDAELVFLSACSTAAADGTPARAGFSGLADSFLSAGARSLVVTEWKVQTRPAYVAVTEALKASKDGATSGEAMRLARLAMARQFGAPSYWSAFVYIGDPGHRWALK